MKSLLVLSISLLLVTGCGQKPSGTELQEKTPTKKAAPAPVNPAFTGSISGVVKFEGTAPKAAAIDMSQDPACVMKGGTNASEAYQVKGGKLANVFVYVKDGLGNADFGTPTAPVVIDQKGCRYVPHVAGAVVGQKVQFLNSDPTMHNVHPDAQVNSPWNISQTPLGEPVEKSFPKAEMMMKVSCNQHPWMRMYLNVVAHPFFAVTDAEGKFEIRGLPPGEYMLGFVHEKMGEATARVKVEAQKTSMAEMVMGLK